MKKYIIAMLFLLFIPFVTAHESCNETIIQENITEILPEGYCNVSLSLETNKQYYKNGEKIEIYNGLSNRSHEFKIKYWIENNNGTIIKEKLETLNLNPKQFTPRLADNTTLVIKNNLTFIDCININNKTYNELEVFVEVEKDPNSNITIKKLYLNRSKRIYIGNNLTAQIAVYSGNQTNFTFTTEIENITNRVEHTIEGIFNYTIMNITTQIPYDCNIQNNTYTLAARTGELESKQNFTILNNCSHEVPGNGIKSEVNISIDELPPEPASNESNSSESIISFPGAPLTGRTIYESSNIKAKKIATYLFMVILAAILIGLISKSKDTEKTLKESTEKWSSQLEQL